MKPFSIRVPLTLGIATMIAQFSPLAHALESDGSMAVRLPRGTPMRNTVVSAAGTLTVGDRAQIAGPTATVGLLANAESGKTQIGVSALVSSNVISTPQVFLSNYAKLAASLFTTTAPSKQAGATIVGTVKTDASLSPSTLVRWTPPAAATGPDFIVYPDHIGTLTAGAYKRVAVYSRSEVTLGAGTYQMESFDIEPQATVEFDNRLGPIVIYVGSELLLKGTATVLGSASDFAIVYTGGNAVNVETPFSGAIVAPYAALRLAAMGSKRFVGQFFGKSVVVDPDVKVTYSKFNWDSIQPLLGADPATALTKTDPLPQQTFPTCYSPSFAGTLGTGTGGSRYYTSLTYVTPNPGAGVCAPVFVDKSGNPIAAPTQAQLNTKPPATSTCTAVPANVDHCPIDADTLTTTCSTDADCSAGQLCAAFCTDMGCTSIENRCGSPSASCGELPQEGSCEDHLLEPLPGAVGTPNPTQLASQLAPTTSPSPGAMVDPSKQDVPPAYSSAASQECSAPLHKTETTQDGSDKPANDGNSEWGVYLKPVTSFKIKPVKRADTIGMFSLSAEGGIAAGGIIFGTKVEVLKASVSASLDECGIQLIGAVKLFGEAVATWTPGAADKYHLATNSKNDSLATPKLDSDACKDAHDRTMAAIFSARNTNALARAAKQYYLDHGLTPELCNQIQTDLGPIKDNSGNPYDCSNPAGMDPIGQINFVNAWKKEYEAYVKNFKDFSKEIGVAQQKIHAAGTVEVFKKSKAYSVQVLNQYFPIGPVTLNLAVEGFGRWSLGGGIQFGVSTSGDPEAMLKDLLQSSELPKIGDVRAYGGPVFTPALGVGVLAFVGVGIPGVAVGIQGQIDLLDISLPSGIAVAAMRVSEPDTRPLAGTDFAGTPLPDMEPKQYKWHIGYSWDSKLDLAILKGQLDLALRIKFLAFKRTFKKTLFSWPGFQKSFTLISGGAGGALKYANDYGKQADDVAYTEIPEITGPITTNPTGPYPPGYCYGG